MDSIQPQEFLVLLPEIVLATAGMLLLLSGALKSSNGYRICSAVSLAALVGTAVLLVTVQGVPETPRVILSGMFIVDGYAFFWKLLFLMAAALTVVLSDRFLSDGGYRPAEFYSLILLATTGMLFMASGHSLLSIWISLELMALSSYILAGFFKHERKSNEAALKYFILGALSSGILVYGISLLYGATGTVQLDLLASTLPSAMSLDAGYRLAAAGWLLLAMGLFFKVAAVPFHVWTPDVYEGAPTPVTVFLATASKAASFAILVRIFYQGLPYLRPDWQWVTAGIAVITMIWGNLAALTQSNVKRMLAYSSVAHAGYVLMGVLAATEDGLWSVLFYLFAYTFITIGTFGTVILLERKEYAGETYDDYAGLAQRSPFLAAMMLVFMLALTGIPPTGGFFGKIYLFAAAVEAGWIWVAVVGVLTSAISLFYYIGIAVQMYLKDSSDDTPSALHAPGLVGTIALCAVVTVLLGILPGPLVQFAKSSLGGLL
ncbi:MAG: NADH-quinone oxidoreductase subunit N [bacterium]|nr:NADH-quinone oxidoreductase subunit N [bacterium]